MKITRNYQALFITAVCKVEPPGPAHWGINLAVHSKALSVDFSSRPRFLAGARASVVQGFFCCVFVASSTTKYAPKPSMYHQLVGWALWIYCDVCCSCNLLRFSLQSCTWKAHERARAGHRCCSTLCQPAGCHASKCRIGPDVCCPCTPTPFVLKDRLLHAPGHLARRRLACVLSRPTVQNCKRAFATWIAGVV